MAAATSSSKFDTGKNLIAFTILPSKGDEGRNFVPEPPMTKEKIYIWQKHVLIPFTLSGKFLAFLGPLPTAKTQPGKAPYK
ncbi:hypothetical protein KIW84_024279 [Lathyrus oleraceus]|uniref:Uncharacterized protein n=1 Tax=Pisum sativum TaxID=3888 RepID=A0A9D4YG47_PEA|nr:hypothetical protein KIW84_024279 [Pisum sativum]